MTTLTKSQEWKLKQIRKESNFLWMNETLGNEVFNLGKEWKTANEITWHLWQREDAEKFWISPEAIDNYLKDRGLDSRTRKAIKFSPIVESANHGIAQLAWFGYDEEWNKINGSDNDAVKLKALTWIADKYDLDTEPKWEQKGVTNIFQMSGITQIIVE